MQIFGLMIVRNEADILRINLLHHLAQGIDQFLIVDNGSTDGTTEVLEEMSRETGRVHWTRDEGPYRQAEITTELAHEAYLRGADWVVPIDADEFWHAPGGDLRAVLEQTEAGALEVQVVNFVQRREQLEATADALVHMTRRVAQPVGPIERIVDLVETRQIGFVEILYPPKWISRATGGIEIGMGNHNVEGVVGPRAATDQIVCLHAPLRARSVLDAKMIDLGKRAEDEGALGGEKLWHYRRWRRLGDENGLDVEWRANSYENESLDVYGVEHRLVDDSSLRDVVSPWLRRSDVSEFAQEIGSARPLELRPETTSSQAALVASILARMRDIDGWLPEREACLLMTATVLALIEQEPPHAIVEVGSYCGRSTVVLGSVVNVIEPDARIYAIDPHQGQVSSYDTETRFESPTLEVFKHNIAAARLDDIVEVLQQHSFDVRWKRPISLLFIDGLHDYENVSRDFTHFDPWVVPGGYVAFDDYDIAFPGVISFVNELLASGNYEEIQRVGKMIVTQKTSDAHRGSAKDQNEDPIGTDEQRPSAASPSAEWLAERLARQEKGIAFLKGLIKDELTRHEDMLEERDAVIVGQQAELHEKVGEANRIISELQAEMHGKVGEANVVIRELQAQLAAAPDDPPRAAQVEDTSAAHAVELTAETLGDGPSEVLAELPTETLAKHDRAIRALEAELATLRRPGAWHFVKAYYGLRKRLRAEAGRLRRRAQRGR